MTHFGFVEFVMLWWMVLATLVVAVLLWKILK